MAKLKTISALGSRSRLYLMYPVRNVPKAQAKINKGIREKVIREARRAKITINKWLSFNEADLMDSGYVSTKDFAAAENKVSKPKLQTKRKSAVQKATQRIQDTLDASAVEKLKASRNATASATKKPLSVKPLPGVEKARSSAARSRATRKMTERLQKANAARGLESLSAARSITPEGYTGGPLPGYAESQARQADRVALRAADDIGSAAFREEAEAVATRVAGMVNTPSKGITARLASKLGGITGGKALRLAGHGIAGLGVALDVAQVVGAFNEAARFDSATQMLKATKMSGPEAILRQMENRELMAQREAQLAQRDPQAYRALTAMAQGKRPPSPLPRGGFRIGGVQEPLTPGQQEEMQRVISVLAQG